MPESKYAETLIAGDFPPGLNTAMPAHSLEPNETPDSYGFDLTKEGRIAKGTIPTGTSRIQLTKTVSTVPYLWHYNRLWNITGLATSGTSTVLNYGAPLYDDVFYRQRSGKIEFGEDSNVITALVPFGADSLCVAKSTGSYIIANCSDPRAFFTRSDIVQELAAAGPTYILEMDGNIFACNASGLIVYADGSTIDLTAKVRDSLTNYEIGRAHV